MNYLSMQQLCELYNDARNRTLNRQYFSSIASKVKLPGAFKVGDNRGGKWLITEEGAQQVIKTYVAPYIGNKGDKK